MNNKLTATLVFDKDSWIGWINEISGVNTQGATLEELICNLRDALREHRIIGAFSCFENGDSPQLRGQSPKPS